MVNNFIGQVTDKEVNKHNALAFRFKAMDEHERQWPERFRNAIPKVVDNIKDRKKCIKFGSERFTTIKSYITG